jgi:hypothetical protein
MVHRLQPFPSVIICIYMFLSMCRLAPASDVTLAWDPSPSGSVAGYKLYMGNTSGVYQTSVFVGNHTWYQWTGLSADPHYFVVTALDAYGNESSFSNEVSINTTPSKASPGVFLLPRFQAGQHSFLPDEENWTGIALTNTGLGSADLTFTALDSEGNALAGPQIVNPATLRIYGGNQLARLDTEIFGNGILQSDPNSWIRVESSGPGISGFYLMFNNDVTLMDGSYFSSLPLADFVLTDIEDSGSTRISVANDNSVNATVDFELVTAGGSVLKSVSRNIKARGSMAADLFGDLFIEATPDPTNYVRAYSNPAVHAFELMLQETDSIAILAGQQAGAGSPVLFSPQYVADETYRTSLSIINLDPRAGSVRLRLRGDDGSQIGTVRTAALEPNGKLYIEDQGFFQASQSSGGYVEIASDGIKLTGSVLFGDIRRRAFLSALPLVSSLQTSAVFSHVASNDLYFTGIAIVNPNATEASVELQVYSDEGNRIDSTRIRIPAGQRRCRLLTEFLPAMAGISQLKGYIRLNSDIPVASFCMFGTHSLSMLSAIPGQAPP